MSILKLRGKCRNELRYQLFGNPFYIEPCGLLMPAAAERGCDNTDIDSIEGAKTDTTMRFGILSDNTNCLYPRDALNKLICHIGIPVLDADFLFVLVRFIRNDESPVIIRLHAG